MLKQKHLYSELELMNPKLTSVDKMVLNTFLIKNSFYNSVFNALVNTANVVVHSTNVTL